MAKCAYDFDVPTGRELSPELKAALARREARREAHKTEPPAAFQGGRAVRRKAADPDAPHERTAEFQAVLDAIDDTGRRNP